MNFDDRVKAIADFGFTERQARFLVTVMLHAGVWCRGAAETSRKIDRDDRRERRSKVAGSASRGTNRRCTIELCDHDY
jgi:hypothetical protein